MRWPQGTAMVQGSVWPPWVHPTYGQATVLIILCQLCPFLTMVLGSHWIHTMILQVPCCYPCPLLVGVAFLCQISEFRIGDGSFLREVPRPGNLRLLGWCLLETQLHTPSMVMVRGTLRKVKCIYSSFEKTIKMFKCTCSCFESHVSVGIRCHFVASILPKVW
jgi:hypothetical protein